MSEVVPERRWGRVLGEGLLIVFSILMAFGIEAWWGQRGERLEEVEALQGLESDFSENVERLAAARAGHRRVHDASVRLLELTGPNVAQGASDLTMDTLVMRLLAGPKVFPVTATFDALIASGRIDLLGSAELRRTLARWSTASADLGEVEREARVQMDQRFLPLVWDYVPVVTLDLNVLADYEDSGIARSRFPRRYRDLLRSIRFENAVEERMNSSLSALQRIDEAAVVAERVLAIVGSELR